MPAAVLASPTMLTRSNTKLGNDIHAFSIPAGKTCPGKTSHCLANCYALKFRFRSEAVKAKYELNLARTKRKDFVTQMIREIAYSHARVVRLHVAGDFRSAVYVRKWYEIIRRSPNVRFFAYTRSWQDKKILPEIIKLAKLPNLQLWLSEDRETGTPPKIPGTLTAFMVIDDLDETLIPEAADLVFRDKLPSDRRILKTMNGVQVCPYENGVEYSTPMTCSKCGLCWRKNLTDRLRSKES